MKRWVRRDRRIYDSSTCKLCGSAYGGVYPDTEHAPSTCLACGSRQCIGNGLCRGTCAICYVGLLPGWSGTDRKCQYKGCKEKAVARVDGLNKYRCRSHLERGKYLGYVGKQLDVCGQQWVLVDEQTTVGRGGV